MRRMALAVVAAPLVAAFGDNLVVNGGFEAAVPAVSPATTDQGYGVWHIKGDPLLRPDGWTLNPALTGTLELPEHEPGKGLYLRLTCEHPGRHAHLFQALPRHLAGQWYVVTGRARGTGGSVGHYLYPREGGVSVTAGYTLHEPTGEWTPFTFWFRSDPEDTKAVCLYVCANPGGKVMEVDDLTVAPTAVVTPGTAAAPIVFENDAARLTFTPAGELAGLTDKRTGMDYAGPRQPAFELDCGSRGRLPLAGIEQRGDRLILHAVDPAYRLELWVKTYARYFTVLVSAAEGPGIESLTFLRLNLTVNENFGSLLNTASRDGFSVVLLSCNDQTHASSSGGSHFTGTARAYASYGIAGAKAVFAALPAADLEDCLEDIQIEQALLHLVRDGVWLRRHPGRFASYLMTGGVTERTVDEIIAFAKGGFGCIHITDGWWEAAPLYEPRRDYYPDGLKSMKAVADKVHAAGLLLGLHTMQGMVGWGGRNGIRSPYVTPVADPRLKQSRRTALAAESGLEGTELTAVEDLAEWPDKGDLFVDGEVVRYAARDGNRFTGCVRGLHDSRRLNHPAGTAVGLLVNCFPNWGGCIYTPEIESTMFQEIVERLAHVFNETGADMAYFDGGEEWAKNPPHWRNTGRFAIAFQKRLRKPIFLGGNNLYTNLSWHAVTRGPPNFDPITFGRDEFSLRFKGTNPQHNARNLLVGDTGWFRAHPHSLSTDAVTPDEVMLICLKAVAGNSPFSLQVSHGAFYVNRRMPEMLSIIKLCDQLKREASLDAPTLLAMQGAQVRHTLESGGWGTWRLRRLHASSPKVLRAGVAGCESVMVANPFAEQAPALRIRALSRLADYGSPDNLVLVDFSRGVQFQDGGTASAQLTQGVVLSDEPAPDGSAAIMYRARNQGPAASGWGRLTLPFGAARDLSAHRFLGLWVHGNGKGGILNVQLTSSEQAGSVREHYVDLGFEGWKLVVLEQPETARFYDYKWPYAFPAPMYRPYPYRAALGMALYLNAVPPGVESEVKIGRIEALREYNEPLLGPTVTIAGKSLRLPLSLRTHDYLEVDRDGIYRLFEPNGGLLLAGRVSADLLWPADESEARFGCETGPGRSNRCELTLYAVDGVLQDIALKEPAEPPPTALTLRRGDKGALRTMSGMFEMTGLADPKTILTYDGSDNAWKVHAPWLDGPPRPVAVSVAHSAGGLALATGASHQGGLMVEPFADLAPFAEGQANTYARRVSGAGKTVTEQGVAAEGVKQSLAPLPAALRREGGGAWFTATNSGRGDWSAKGRRFEKALDLSAYGAVSLWLHGDRQGQTLRVQFWDAAGRHADWSIPIDFGGWRQFPLALSAAQPGFDWSQVEYLILVYNNLPPGRECAVGLAGLRALKVNQDRPRALEAMELVINGHPLALPAMLAEGDMLLLDADGTGSVWSGEGERLRTFSVPGAVLCLDPGVNRLELRCGAPYPGRAEVRVFAVP